MPGDLDHVIILTSSTQLIALVYNMDEWRICGKPEFNAIFLRLRWQLEDFDQVAGWGMYTEEVQDTLQETDVPRLTSLWPTCWFEYPVHS